MHFKNLASRLSICLPSICLIALLSVISFSNSLAQTDCNVEVTFTWTLDSDWCESWCKVRNSTMNQVAGYFSACQNQGCSACDINDLYGWTGQSMNATLENGTYIITQTISLPEGDYTIEMHDGYGDGWSYNATGGVDALTITGNIIYHIDFTSGFYTTGEITLSCDPDLPGCTDDIACNYNSNAGSDDGSCLYFDACGICDGSGIPDGYCDCIGNTVDAVGECGGDCLVDYDNDGICDDCPGTVDECGTCNGMGAIFECGCEDMPEGDCDCFGNQLDAIGVCGGSCQFDLNNNGVCDNYETPGCIDTTACNYASWATVDDGTCEYCSCVTVEEYSLTIEATAPVAVEGTTYRFYVNMTNTTDHLSAVFGDSSAPIELNTPAGAFNSIYNSSWSASGINPAFFSFFPELADDTFATVGLDVPALASGMANAEDPSLVEDSTQPITPYFVTNGAEQLLANTLTGSTYFVLNSASNGKPDADMRVLILQITTTGSISGILNYQVFPFGIGADQIQRTISFNGAGEFGGGGTELCGCTSVNACNYNAAALYDDGSCEYNDQCGICDGPGPIYECGCFDIPEDDCDCNGNQLDVFGVCGGDCEADIDSDGICDDIDPCVGAYDSCGVCNGPGEVYECGCEDIPDGDCDCSDNQLDALGVCGGLCEADIDIDGICDDVDPCVGAYDSCGVCNGPGEVYECGCEDMPEGDCDCEGNQLDALGICGGDCETDEDNDGICDDEDECVGAYDSCGVCNGPGEVYECGCEDMPEGDCDCEGNEFDELGVCGGDCEADEDGNGVCDDEEVEGCMDYWACNYAINATEDDGSCTYDCYGCIDPEACNFDEEATLDGGGCIMPGDACDDGLVYTIEDFLQEDCSCNGYGCGEPEACNYAPNSITDNDLCNYVSSYGITGLLSASNSMLVSYSYPNTNGSTYLWSITNGDITDGEGTANIEVVWWGDAAGQLCVVETNIYGCEGDISCINVSITNSISEVEEMKLVAYPNPVTDMLHIEFKGRCELKMRDVMGRVVWVGEVQDEVLAIDVSIYQRGLYTIEAISETGPIRLEKILLQ